jgi:peptidase inhibitor family I36
MSRKIITYVAIMFGLIIGGLVSAAPAQASLSQCDATYVCAWTNANYGGNFMEWQPSAVFWADDAHCLNFDSTVMQDAISSVKSNNGAMRQVRFYKDINCYGPWWTITYAGGVADFAGTGFNDTFSSIYVPYCC